MRCETVNDDRNIMALNLVSGLGPVTWAKLHDALGGPGEIIEAGIDRLRKSGVSEKVALNIFSFDKWDEVDRKLEILDRIGGRIITKGHLEYPKGLVGIHSAPFALYVLGQMEPGDELSVAIVGTRKPGGYGKRIARKLAFQIASSGVTVVSGLAMGIDGQAHKGALDAKGRTIAVLGSGLDTISPSRHADLALKVAENGAVVSEFPPGTVPIPGNFPRRNRLIAGLSTAVMVIEMPEKSGAGITAKYAVEQNKDVLVVPGPIDDPNYFGSHRLIRQGAKPIFETMDVLESVIPDAARKMGGTEPYLVEVSSTLAQRKLTPEKAHVLKEIGSEPIHIDQIAGGAGLTIENVSTILLELELENLVVQLPGKLFRINLEA